MPLPTQSGFSRLIERESGISILGSWTVDPVVLRPLEVAAVLRLGGKG